MTVKLVKEITSRKIQKSAKVVRSLGSRGYFFKPWAHPKLPCELYITMIAFVTSFREGKIDSWYSSPLWQKSINRGHSVKSPLIF